MSVRKLFQIRDYYLYEKKILKKNSSISHSLVDLGNGLVDFTHGVGRDENASGIKAPNNHPSHRYFPSGSIPSRGHIILYHITLYYIIHNSKITTVYSTKFENL